MANTVTLTFAGETSSAEAAFGRVGGAARDMGKTVEQSGDSFDRASERADSLDTKAMGFRDTLTGIQDGALGVKQAASGDWGFETLLLLGFGLGDMASGMVNFLIPALKNTRIGILLTTAATKMWTIAQKALNVVMRLNPVGLGITAVFLLIAVIVAIATKTRWFQTIWRVAWAGIRTAASNTWNFIKRIPGWIGSAFRSVAGFITAPFRLAFAGIRSLWNSTLGGKGFSIPSWVPGIGGKGFTIPRLHAGGVIPGVRGEAVPFLGLAGERVLGPASSGGGGEQWIRLDMGELGAVLLEPIRREVARRGGSVTALGVKIRGGVVS